MGSDKIDWAAISRLASTHAADDSHALVGVMNVFGEFLGAVRLGNFKGEESLRGRVIGEERKVWNVEVLWRFVFIIVDGGVRDIVGRWEELGNFSFFNMVDFFKHCDGGPSVFSFSSGEDRGRGVEDGGVGNGIFICGARGRAVVVLVVIRHDREVEVREEGRVLIKVCEA